jgi:hypothetical protein
MVVQTKISDIYEFECVVVKHENPKPIIIKVDIYRSEYREFYKGTKTSKCEFTLLPYGKNEYMAYVFSIDDNKKKGIKEEFRGNLLWGFGKSISLKNLETKIYEYTNLDQVKKDFDL